MRQSELSYDQQFFRNWSDSNFIPIESKKFEFWNLNLAIKIYIKYESEIEIMRSPDFRIVLSFSIWNYETLTRFCGNTVFRNLNLTGASERGPRDLFRLVLWRYTNIVIIWVFMIPLNWSNRRFFKIRNHKLSWKNSYILEIFSICLLYKSSLKAIYGFWS